MDCMDKLSIQSECDKGGEIDVGEVGQEEKQ